MGQRYPIQIADVDRVLGESEIAELAKKARLPPGSDLTVFGDVVRDAVRIYLAEGTEPSIASIVKEIRQLYRRVGRVIEGKGGDAAVEILAVSLRDISDAARNHIEERAERLNR